MNLSEQTMWKAVIHCDPYYDDLFCYAVKTTMIFCRPSCKSKEPKPFNVEYFYHPKQAMQKGYRPCKRCRPDLPRENCDIDGKTVRMVKTILDSEYSQPWTLQNLSKKAGVSPWHLQRMFKSRIGISPKQYLIRVRIQQAKQLLLQGELNNMEVGFEVGFQNAGQFYKAFRKITGYTPSKFKCHYSHN
ncbi:bifunctional transcriptional activator/DNA repair enzyme AdaA [Melghirimyces algeriensis]|uniref:AraC family transcriptional regulator, regulatory protein of adaptative response / methylphosphotriester-DNA alkyltransferase methyltransferase n=1 Tax=Melghirimyces algeriensis TaxID=910412 RepID=A0A521EM68_9BACL|nr:Ada metal-binding domain-containing protein [Melghirimyces algeriensis]SMO84210.1 AraC family transcriptional regulator, regulatory protein of adaptative response / methylphosphotriester-DNA alkyltransferase methyltransferase [Melghirimyces algeriensis]